MTSFVGGGCSSDRVSVAYVAQHDHDNPLGAGRAPRDERWLLIKIRAQGPGRSMPRYLKARALPAESTRTSRLSRFWVMTGKD